MLSPIEIVLLEQTNLPQDITGYIMSFIRDPVQIEEKQKERKRILIVEASFSTRMNISEEEFREANLKLYKYRDNGAETPFEKLWREKYFKKAKKNRMKMKKLIGVADEVVLIYPTLFWWDAYDNHEYENEYENEDEYLHSITTDNPANFETFNMGAYVIRYRKGQEPAVRQIYRYHMETELFDKKPPHGGYILPVKHKNCKLCKNGENAIMEELLKEKDDYVDRVDYIYKKMRIKHCPVH